MPLPWRNHRLLTEVLLPQSGAVEPRGFCQLYRAGQATAITYGELRNRSAGYAAMLQQYGVRHGDVVAIILPHGSDLFAAFLGIMLLGAIPSFMPPRTPKQDAAGYWSAHRTLFSRLGCRVLTDPENRAELQKNCPEMAGRFLCTDKVIAGAVFTPLAIDPADTAFLQHSSGTTGLKKGVALSHDVVLRQIRRYAKILDLREDDCIVSWLPLYHDMGLIACFLLPLVTGTPLVLLDPFDWVAQPGLLFDAIKTHRGTLCWQPNFAFQHLCRTVRPAARLDLSTVRAWINCSEPCQAETLEQFARTFASAGVKPEHLQVCYAMAETVFAVTQTRPAATVSTLTVSPEPLQTTGRIELAPDETGRRLVSTGSVLPGLSLRITNAQGETLGDDHVGEITLAGDFLFSGYHLQPDLTAQKFRDGWYHTGDLGFLHRGELFVTGRKNDLLIVHGKNHYAHDLEFLLQRIPGVHPGRAVALGWYRPEVGSEDVVIVAETSVVTPDERNVLAEAIRQALLNGAGLQPFDVQLVGPGWLLKTTSGKINRPENLRKYQEALMNAPIPCPP